MQRPNDVDASLALDLLDITTRTWAHGADANFAAFQLLVARGVPLDYAETSLPLPHPILRFGHGLWTPAEGGTWVVDGDSVRREETQAERAYAASPLRSGSASERRSLLEGLDPELLARVMRRDAVLEAPLRISVDGYTDALLANLAFDASTLAVFLFATRAAGGFTELNCNALHTMVWVMTPIARANRWRAVSHVIATTYIGPVTGRRVLAGELQLGEVERRNAVVWFSDLRGFTSLSAVLEPEEVVRRINVMFDRVAGAIHDHGGEVLKLIGDAVLGIFPYDEEDGARAATQGALGAARACATLPNDLAIGTGLHRGEVAYGNVGASDRLDFTVIGRTVNVASRVEGLTGHLGKRVLASAEVAACAPEASASVGHHALKGIFEPVELFELLL